MGEFVKTVEDLKDKDGNVIASGVEVFTLDAVAPEISDAQRAAIGRGDLQTNLRTVVYSVKDGDKIVKEYRQTYTQFTAKNEIGALLLPAINGDAEKVWSYVSDRADTVSYQPVYVRLRNAAAGPEAAAKKFAKFMATLSPEQLAKVQEMALAAKG